MNNGQCNKLGIVIPHLGVSQTAFYVINETNKFIKSTHTDCVLFYESVVLPCIKPLCSTLCVNGIVNFNGVLITTTIDTTIMATKINNVSKIIFYLWDVEWLRIGNQNFLYNLQAYRSNVELICRTKDHIDLVKNYCNRQDVRVVENFELKKILGV